MSRTAAQRERRRTQRLQQRRLRRESGRPTLTSASTTGPTTLAVTTRALPAAEATSNYFEKLAEMDFLDLPPPAEPIDTSIGQTVITNRKKQPKPSLEINLGTKPKTIDKTIARLVEDQWKVIQENNTENKHKPGPKKKKKKKKNKKDISRENRSPQKAAVIPDIDYEKIASAQTICSDITDPKYKKPFDYGWRRELVFRATVRDDTQKLGDVYYYTPNGFRLRSMVELAQVELKKGLTLDNFSFYPEPTGVNNLWKETIRAAVFRDKETVAQTRQDVREKLKTVKRKLTTNCKRPKRRRKAISYYDRDSSDFDEDMADEVLTALSMPYGIMAEIKTEKVTSRVYTEQDDSNELIPLAIKQEKTDSQSQEREKLQGCTTDTQSQEPEKSQGCTTDTQSQEPEKSQGCTTDTQSQEPEKSQGCTTDTQSQEPEKLQGCQGVPSNKCTEIVIKKEKDNRQLHACVHYVDTNKKLDSPSHDPKKPPEIIVNTEKGLLQGSQEVTSNKWPDIVIKKEKDDTQLKPCVSKDVESNKIVELIITNVRSQFEDLEPISTPDKVVEKVVNETGCRGIEEDLGPKALPKKNEKVNTKDIAVQTVTLNESKEKDDLIDRLRMENMFLKEKLANFEKSISSSCMSNVHEKSNSLASRKVLHKVGGAEKDESDCDWDVICVNEEYETVDLVDSD